MKKQMQNRPAQVCLQVERMRRLYSGIGEPLPVDVIFDLHRHLGAALKCAEEEKTKSCGRKMRTQA